MSQSEADIHDVNDGHETLLQQADGELRAIAAFRHLGCIECFPGYGFVRSAASTILRLGSHKTWMSRQSCLSTFQIWYQWITNTSRFCIIPEAYHLFLSVVALVADHVYGRLLHVV